MTKELDTVRGLVQQHGTDLAFVVNHSGGKDSTRMLGKDGTTGVYLRRFSCRVCIFSTDADLRAIYQHDRAAFELVSNLETKLGFTMRPGASLVQIGKSQVSTPVETERQQSFSFCP